jgi:hypothetical protein
MPTTTNQIDVEEIKNEIIEMWNNYNKDGVRQDVIDEFKWDYHMLIDSPIYDFDFEIEPHNIMDAQRFVIENMESSGYEFTAKCMLSLTTMEGLKKAVLYWAMEEIDFHEEEMWREEICV